MITPQSMRGIKVELSDWLGEDVVAYVNRRHKQDGESYPAIAIELRESGFNVTGTQLSGWVYMSRVSK